MVAIVQGLIHVARAQAASSRTKLSTDGAVRYTLLAVLLATAS